MYDNIANTKTNSNAKIAKVLEDVSSTLTNLDKINLNQALADIENGLSKIEVVAQETETPILRALIHWMQLNIEIYDNNEDQIHSLLKANSYSDWAHVLTSLLRNYDPSLLPVLHQSLTTPEWPINPSAPLLKSVAAWIMTTKIDSNEDKGDEISDVSSEETSSSTIVTSHNNTIVDDTEHEQQNIFVEVERDILDKEYDDEESAAILKELEEVSEGKSTLIETDKSSISIDDIDQEIQSDTAFDGLSAVHPNAFDEIDEQAENIHDSIKNAKASNKYLKEAEDVDFSEEADDIVMSLASISALSDDIVKNAPEYIKQLERFSMLGETTEHAGISNASEWCQRNIHLFAENQTDAVKIFIGSGECWSWIELTNACISDPGEVSNLSALSTELSRDEWLEPITVEDLQALLLSLRGTDDNNASYVKALDIEESSLEDFKQASLAIDTPELIDIETEEEEETKSSSETSGLQLNWDDDTHPELLTVYLEETPDQIAQLQPLLIKITNNDADKDEKHTASRMAHTIKGGSAIVGITALSEFSYQLETLLDHSVNHPLPQQCLDLLPEAGKCYDALFDAIQTQQTEPKDFLSLLTKLKSFVENLDENDETLELSAFALPDFIVNQNNVDTSNIEASTQTEKASTSTDDLVNEALDDIINDPADIEESAVETVSINDVRNDEKNEQLTETVLLNKLDSSEEINDISVEIDDIVMTLSCINQSNDDLAVHLEEYSAELQRFDILTELSGYPELSVLSDWCRDNLNLFADSKSEKSKSFVLSGEAWSWLELLGICLNEPDEISHLSTLSAEFIREEWQQAIATDDLQVILLSLRKDESKNTKTSDDVEPETSNKGLKEFDSTVDIQSVSEDTDEEVIEDDIHQRETDITAEESNQIISWDKDVHPELLAVYFQETPDQINEVAELLQKISKGNADSEDHKKAARIAHTIKGASGVVGINSLVDLTHKLEDILDFSVNNKLPAETSELLAEASDCLEQLFETIQNKQAAPEELTLIVNRLSDYAKSLDAESTISDEDFELPEFVEQPTADNNSKNTETALDTALNNALNTAATDNLAADAYIRVPVNVIDRLLNLAGELVTSSAQVSDHLENTLLTSKQIKSQDTRVHKMLEELSNTISQQEKDQANMLSNLEESDFDSLEMDTYNELHSVAGLLTESILDSEEIDRTLNKQLNDLNEDMRSLDKLNKELSEVILKSRMVSLQTLVPRLERIVRQTCRKTGKQAELTVIGNNINIDTDILNGLVDPLLHLLRNAIDHGIESSEIRKKKNKTEIGKINLKFSREGNNILMQLKDDGAGIDSELIYQKAIDKGLITPEQEFSSQETLKLILHPGFSTQDNVSDISGRGVGMDVVNNAVEDLKGSLQISSELEQGTIFDIKIPSTLVTNTTLLVRASDNPVAIPTDTIEQLLYVTANDVTEKDGKHYVKYDGKELEIHSLSELLDWSKPEVDFSESQTLLMIKDNDQMHAIHIEEILYSREVVIKNLNPWVNMSKGVVGACHLNDGGVAPVLHLSQIVARAKSSEQTTTKSAKKAKDSPNKKVKRIKQILVVDDSLSNRKALSLIIEQTEYDVITAVDGLDALQIMNENPVDMVFTDLEMPRMNGLELTQAIRAWTDKSGTPIVMVTSRTTAKHRELAEKAGVDDYLTKPVVTETLLDALTTWIDSKAMVK